MTDVSCNLLHQKLKYGTIVIGFVGKVYGVKIWKVKNFGWKIHRYFRR